MSTSGKEDTLSFSLGYFSCNVVEWKTCVSCLLPQRKNLISQWGKIWLYCCFMIQPSIHWKSQMESCKSLYPDFPNHFPYQILGFWQSLNNASFHVAFTQGVFIFKFSGAQFGNIQSNHSSATDSWFHPQAAYWMWPLRKWFVWLSSETKLPPNSFIF